MTKRRKLPNPKQTFRLKPKAEPRDTSDDIAFDPDGNTFLIGADAGAMQERIVDHPNAKPVMVVALVEELGLGVRVYGLPNDETADILDQVALTYRKALNASRASKQ